MDVLIPTADRPAELAVTLAGLAAQDDPAFRVVVSDQSEDPDTLQAPAVAAMVRVLRAQGRQVEIVRHLPRRGMVEQRQFLLDRARAAAVLFLERIRRDSPAHARSRLHNAANLAHIALARGLTDGRWLPYHVAWIGGCGLYRPDALEGCGGFGFWGHFPPAPGGEDVVAQWRVMERFGGAGILPSGAVHLESATTLPDRRVDAPDHMLRPEQ